MVVSAESLEVFIELLSKINRPTTFMFPDSIEVCDIQVEYPSHECIVLDEYSSSISNIEAHDVFSDSAAYLLFTYGSTGIPKGVAIIHDNVLDYVAYTCNRYSFNEINRFSQAADMSFALRILEIFSCWASGACLCYLPKSSVMVPAKFIKDNGLTVWISVPSIGIIMSIMRLLKADSFPTLRFCLFDGEPLLANIASL